MIDEELLLRYGGQSHSYSKDEALFKQDEQARFYHQIAEGEVKMCNFNEDGKEFIQRIFSAGRSFGEPPLFGDFGYPAHAIALTDCLIWKLPRTAFYQLLRENHEVHFELTAAIASRLYYKALMASELSHEDPAHRILRLLHYLKNDVYKIPGAYTYEVELTRQQIADLTGLRVETTIRAIKKLEAQEALKIVNRKIKI